MAGRRQRGDRRDRAAGRRAHARGAGRRGAARRDRCRRRADAGPEGAGRRARGRRRKRGRPRQRVHRHGRRRADVQPVAGRAHPGGDAAVAARHPAGIGRAAAARLPGPAHTAGDPGRLPLATRPRRLRAGLPATRWWTAFDRAVAAELGAPLPRGPKRFADDGNSFSDLAGIPAITHGPRATGAHTVDERVAGGRADPRGARVRRRRPYATAPAPGICGGRAGRGRSPARRRRSRRRTPDRSPRRRSPGRRRNRPR